MEHTETPALTEASLAGDILSITFANGETHRWAGVPQTAYDALQANFTYHGFATLIRPHYKLLT